MPLIKTAKASRASYKGQLTTVKNTLNEYVKDDTLLLLPSATIDLRALLDSIERIDRKFQEVQMTIIQGTDNEEERVKEQEELIQFLEDCAAEATRVNRFIRMTEEPRTSSPRVSNDDDNPSLSQLVKLMTMQLDEQKKHREREEKKLEMLLKAQREEFQGYLDQTRVDQGNNSGIETSMSFAVPSASKLEPVRLPKFSGSYAGWTTFHDLFVSIVDKNPLLTKVQKMYHLKTALTGEAEKLVEHLMISEENYNLTFQRLKERYDDKVSIARELMDKFLDLPATTKPNIAALRKIQTDATSTIHALGALKVDDRDPWLIHLIMKKLDRETQWLWAQEKHDLSATWEQFDTFLASRCRALEHCATPEQPSSSAFANSKSKIGVKKASVYAAEAIGDCNYCHEGQHKLYRCRKFLNHPAKARLDVVKDLNLCQNCLSDVHSVQNCTYPPCRSCRKAHNKLIHDAFPSASTHVATVDSDSDSDADSTDTIQKQPEASTLTTLACSESSGGVKSNVLFATAVIAVLDKYGKRHPCRMVLDPASQVNIVSSRLRHTLMLPCQLSRYAVDGVNESTQLCRQETQVKILYRLDGILMSQMVDCLVMPKVTKDQPNWELARTGLVIPDNFDLADPTWNVKQSIDLLIGGALAWKYLGAKKHELGEGLPFLHDSVFGWLVVGPYFKVPPPEPVSCQVTTMVSLDRTLRKFWELEEVPKATVTSEEQEAAEHSFVASHERDNDGRYRVQLPLKSEIQLLESNRDTAVRQLQYLDRRLERSPALREAYLKVFQEYLDLNIVEPIPREELHTTGRPVYYMPHHCVVKEDSKSTKVRPVFNASSKTTAGISLNDCLMVGPVVQPSLISTMWKFRLHPVALTCDITKMYLQILLHEPHKDLQRFVLKWNNQIKDFRFRTVCFGVASSPYLATRVLNQLAQDEEKRFPLAAEVIKRNFYVDDCLFSDVSVERVMDTKQQLKEIFSHAGMSLSKFRSNSAEIMSSESCEVLDEVELLDEESKTLGIVWHPLSDTFRYRVTKIVGQQENTNRLSILSIIARIYDPCGYIGPVITVAKLILQETWALQLSWHAELPDHLEERWKSFITSLPQIEAVRIPRWASNFTDVVHRELHVFCDASSVAYGAVAYLVTSNQKGNISSHMLTAKSRVTPVSQTDNGPVRTLTIPKAELCAALLGAELMAGVSESLGIEDCTYWTDATVVLCQLHSASPKQEVFVKTRVRKILALTSASQWRHVPTADNPADMLSRGITPQKFINNKLWFSGPAWLSDVKLDWPPIFSPWNVGGENDDQACILQVSIDKSDTRLDFHNLSQDHIYHCLLRNISTFTRMRRTLAWISRAVNCMKKRGARTTRSSSSSFHGPLSTEELRKAENMLIRWSQEDALSDAIHAVKSGNIETNHKLNSIRKLRPFIDQNGILRVGGRLGHSYESFDVKHPKLIPKGELAKSLAYDQHRKLLHAGPQLVLSSLRLRYWIIGGRNVVRKIYRDCVTCRRAKPPQSEQLMGELPFHRVTHVRPFAATGVDFTGCIMIKRTPRGRADEKAYVAVFVCMSIKAVHFELVTSLSTDTFIAALRRFVARRGIPRDIYSDNGTNFLGAEKELSRLLKSHSFQEEISNFAAELQTQWHFNPPSAPHQGGLWEAAVRSFKNHFKRIVGQASLMYEELATILTQIEAVLNSRPLMDITEDGRDPAALTPGHFLLGAPPIQLPDPSLAHINPSKLNGWQRCQRLQQHFAQRWKQEYLSTLQIRQKWNKRHENAKIGDIVLLIDEGVAATHWPLGRIEDVHPGKDGVVRVATVRTGKGNYKRPIVKLVKLLRDEEVK